MLHRVTRIAALLGALLVAGCRSSSETGQAGSGRSGTEVVAAHDAAPDPSALSKVHGENRTDPTDDKEVGGFSMFKEAWVYVDGMPVGVLREAELPPLPEVWDDEVEYLDFKKGDPGPHERVYQVRRWRISDYLTAIGVDVEKVKAVLLHGGRGTALIPGDAFRKTKQDLLFDLTGSNELKLRVFLPDALTDLNTSFDRYAAVSIIVDKPLPTTNEENDLVLDGVIMQGIPFYGQPLRGGIRVYVDGRLALVIKRNSLGDEGRVAGKDEWNVARLLEARGVEVARLAAADLLDQDAKATRIEGSTIPALTFTTSTQAQGAVLLSTGQLTNAILMWSTGKVPAPRTPTARERDKP